MKIPNKREYLNRLDENVSQVLEKLARDKGFSLRAYDAIMDIILDTAALSFDEGFEAARLAYAVECINKLADVFKKE